MPDRAVPWLSPLFPLAENNPRVIKCAGEVAGEEDLKAKPPRPDRPFKEVIAQVDLLAHAAPLASRSAPTPRPTAASSSRTG